MKQPRIRRRVTGGILACCTALSVAACSSSDKSTTDNSLQATATTSSSDQSAQADKKEQVTVTYGLASTGAAATTDPHGSMFSESDWARNTALYDPLVVLGDGEEVLPWLAESWEPNDDASEWTFKLRDDAVFSDGTPITAKDVLYSIGRIREKAAENGGRGGAIDMDKSSAPDDNTVVLVLEQPDAELPRSLAGTSFVVKDGTTDFDTPISSGPYVLDTLQDQTAQLHARDDWWGEKPDIDTLVIRGFSDPTAMSQAVSSGAIDMAFGVQPAAAKAAEAAGLKVTTRPGSQTSPILMRVDTAPFDDNRVREAVKLSLDRQKLVDTVLLGYGTPGKDMIRNGAVDKAVPDAPEVKRDVEKAKQLLAEAGHPDGIDVTLHTSNAFPDMIPLAAAAKEQLADSGINVTIEEHPADQYWSAVYGKEPFLVGFYSADPSFATLVRATTLSDAAYSEIGWKRPDFDEKFAKAMATVDPAERTELLGELHRQMAEEGGWAVWGFADRPYVHRDGISDLVVSANPYDVTKIKVEN